MKVLVSTRRGQGLRQNDFCFVDDDEIVCFGSECDGEEIDGTCGCMRALVGINSRKATTTFTSADLDITREEYSKLILDSFISAGWYIDNDFIDGINESIKTLLLLAETFSPGEVVERRGWTFQLRHVDE